jgi:hypothetical protein
MWHAWERGEKCSRIWWESPKDRDRLEDQGVGGKMESEWILGRLAWGVCIGFDWLRTGTGVGLLCVRWWTFGFLRHGVSYVIGLRRRKWQEGGENVIMRNLIFVLSDYIKDCCTGKM